MKINIYYGDITILHVDAIVNAANETLLGGSGVDGAIHRAAGPGLLDECQKLGGCLTGQAKITRGHNLPARYVIHTVGPVWRNGENREAKLLASCYRRCLELAAVNDVTSIAFPCISTGIYRFPKEPAAKIAVETVREFMREHPLPMQVIFACYSRTDMELYKRLLMDHGQ